MAQISLYIPDETAAVLRTRAETEGLSLSKFVLNVLDKELKPTDNGWPPGYREKCIGWLKDGDWEEPEDLPPQSRENWFD